MRRLADNNGGDDMYTEADAKAEREMLERDTMGRDDAMATLALFQTDANLAKIGAKIEIETRLVPLIKVDGAWVSDTSIGYKVKIDIRDARTGVWVGTNVGKPATAKQAKTLGKELAGKLRDKLKANKLMRRVERTNQW